MVQKKPRQTMKPVQRMGEKNSSAWGRPRREGPDYDFIWWVSLPSRKAQAVYGETKKVDLTLYQKQKLHREALARAAEQGIYHYEWACGTDSKTTYFQTTCIALAQTDGKITGILCLFRDISRQGSLLTAQAKVKEWTAPKTFSQLLLAAREAERKEISKSLHDEVGSASVILMALLSLVKVDIKKENLQRALRDLEQLNQQIKQSVERLRSIIVSLRPPTLDNPGGLCGAIEDLLAHISQLSHIPYQFKCKADEGKIALSENVRILLFRIVQEALTNIVKHSRAKHMVVCLKRVGRVVRLQVRDDGIGFNPQESVSIAHVGLLAMKDSVEMLGGTITIKSALGKGTRIEVECPSVVYGGE